MKYKVESDEWYPVHVFDDYSSTEIELSDEEKLWINKAFEEFQKAQTLMGEKIAAFYRSKGV